MKERLVPPPFLSISMKAKINPDIKVNAYIWKELSQSDMTFIGNISISARKLKFQTPAHVSIL